RRTFPNRTVRGGERVTYGTVALRVVDLGPGESPHDSLWLVESNGAAQAFVGDLVYNRMHGFLGDGFYRQWLANIARARRELSAQLTVYPGHGESGPAGELLEWQGRYIRTIIYALRSTRGDHPLTGETGGRKGPAKNKRHSA